MELADERTILEALRPKPRGRAARPVDSRAVQRADRCKCGKCRPCLDDARWERIFAEKFADPNYYDPDRLKPGGSSLCGL